MSGYDAIAWLTLAVAGLAAGAAVSVLIYALWPSRLVEAADARSAASDRPLGMASSMRGVVVDGAAEWNERIGLVRADWAEGLHRRFVMLGQPQLRPAEFRVWQEASALGLGMLCLLGTLMLGQGWPMVLLVGVGGFFLPHLWLRDRIKKRHNQILRALPYNMDLLTLSVEAGLDFQAALATVVDKGRKGALTEELGLMLQEMRLGKTREESLKNLAERVQLVQLSALVSNLVQADRMGTSLGKVLRIQATQMRVERTHRAEKLANEAPVKMLFPLIFCIFPTVFFVLFAPIVYRLFSDEPL